MYVWKYMNMWHAKENCIMGSAQSNPTSTQLDNIYNTHLNTWKYSYNAYEMQCMKFFKIKSSKTHPKNFAKTSLILKNPKNLG